MSFDLDSLVDSWTPPETFEIELMGETLRFKSCSGYGEYKQLERDAGEYALSFQAYRGSKLATMEGSAYAKWRYLPTAPSELKAAYIVRTLLLDEISEEESLYLCKAPLLMDDILLRIKAQHYGKMIIGLNDAVESEKKS